MEFSLLDSTDEIPDEQITESRAGITDEEIDLGKFDLNVEGYQKRKSYVLSLTIEDGDGLVSEEVLEVLGVEELIQEEVKESPVVQDSMGRGYKIEMPVDAEVTGSGKFEIWPDETNVDVERLHRNFEPLVDPSKIYSQISERLAGRVERYSQISDRLEGGIEEYHRLAVESPEVVREVVENLDLAPDVEGEQSYFPPLGTFTKGSPEGFEENQSTLTTAPSPELHPSNGVLLRKIRHFLADNGYEVEGSGRDATVYASNATYNLGDIAKAADILDDSELTYQAGGPPEYSDKIGNIIAVPES